MSRVNRRREERVYALDCRKLRVITKERYLGWGSRVVEGEWYMMGGAHAPLARVVSYGSLDLPHNTLQHNKIQHTTAQYSATQMNKKQYINAVHYDTLQYSTLPVVVVALDLQCVPRILKPTIQYCAIVQTGHHN